MDNETEKLVEAENLTQAGNSVTAKVENSVKSEVRHSSDSEFEPEVSFEREALKSQKAKVKNHCEAEGLKKVGNPAETGCSDSDTEPEVSFQIEAGKSQKAEIINHCKTKDVRQGNHSLKIKLKKTPKTDIRNSSDTETQVKSEAEDSLSAEDSNLKRRLESGESCDEDESDKALDGSSTFDPQTEAIDLSCKRQKLDNPPDFINFAYLCSCVHTERDAVDFAQRVGLIPTFIQCKNCGELLDRIRFRGANQNKLSFRCFRKKCGKEYSAKINTWFEQSKLSVKKSLILVYQFIVKADYKVAIHESSGPFFGNLTTSVQTITEIYNACRQVCLESLLVTQEFGKKIGGEGKRVDVDIFFIKRKNNKGQLIGGQWVLGAIDRSCLKDCFLVAVPDSAEESVVPVLQKHILTDSTIHLEQWSEVNLRDFGFKQGSINKSGDPTGDTWWNHTRASLKSQAVRKSNLDAHLVEQVWRHKNREQKCLFTKFIKDIREFCPGL